MNRPLRSVHRKLIRELWKTRGQMISIALVVATGIMTVITMRGSYESLVAAQHAYYAEARFADVWAPLKRAPVALRKRLAAIAGVTAVDLRTRFVARLELEGVDTPARAQFVSLPAHGRPALNDIRIRAGRYLDGSADSEALISSKFAQARGLAPGDSLRAVINGRARDLHIVGIALSPEFTYAVPPGALFADDAHFGVIWMSESVLGPAFDMDGAFNEALFSINADANPDAVTAAVNGLLDRYGGLGAYLRKDQMSHQILQGELDQNRVMGTAIPAVFLAVAAFLLNLVLGRLVATQRGEIAVLKAFGYRDREVGWHFLQFALAAVLLGVALGVGSGYWLGRKYVALYGQYFDFPQLDYQLSGGLLLVAIGVSLAAAASGALVAVRGAVRLPPAEAMRPEPPARFGAGWIERTRLFGRLPSSLRMISRNLARRPVQSALSALGVASSVAILVIGLFMFDSVDLMMDMQFRQMQREDLTVTFIEPAPLRVARELGHLDGVTRVEPFRIAPARLRYGHRDAEIGIHGLSQDGELRHIVSASGRRLDLPAAGLLLSAALADRLRVERGSLLRVEFLEGRRRSVEVAVAGVVEDFIGLSAYAELSLLHRWIGEPRTASGAYLAAADDQRARLLQALKHMPRVAAVSSPDAMLQSFETQMADSLLVAVGFLLGFASVISVAVIYNGARIALSERGRELASLRVMGFRRSEVSLLLLGEQAVLTIAAIPAGWVLGHALSLAVVNSLQSETYRIPFVISDLTYLTAAGVTLLSASASGLFVRRRIDRLDLIGVLKTRE